MLQAHIAKKIHYEMTGKELRQLQFDANLRQEDIAEGMKDWGWNRRKVDYLQSLPIFSLEPDEMQALLTTLGASSILS